ncbi:endonuclease [Anaerococcus sp. AGMB00486]|uniref:Endonuclease n=1 Tax=Anaerococcus faecalis TaxID=2742993 RepID=A0ABX2N9G5_9FIRM|nr:MULTISPECIES: endonuclease [Anaerococcus]MDY3007255.1 endonuclease [Anaerococcus porci]NVF11157.1 endonuclease [Anaerococcus faecalis]
MKKILKILAGFIGVVFILFLILLSYLWIREYRPKEVEDIKVMGKAEEEIESNKEYKIMTWNIGYAGLDKDTDFFMDGGNMVFPIDKSHVENALDNILKISKEIGADFKLFQEVDRDSKRSYHIDQVEILKDNLGGNLAFALNYKVDFVPFPLPPLGKITSGILTQTEKKIEKSERYQQPIPHKFPVRLANLKRGFSASYLPIKESDKKFVLVNIHLDAYESGNQGRLAQSKQIIDFIDSEYKKGNYVLVGGDFNQELSGVKKEVPEGIWDPSPFPKEYLKDFMKLLYGDSETSVVNDKPYTGKDAYLSTIDGFIVTDNIEVKNIKTIKEQNFQYSDHNPVLLEFKLKN